MTSELAEADARQCQICAALVPATDLEKHTNWHERLVDEVVSAVKVRLNDPSK